SRETQLVVFSEGHLHATDVQFGLINAAGGGGVVVVSLLAGQLRKRWGFVRLGLGAMLLGSLLTVALAFTPNIWLALPVWALVMGMDILFNICTASFRQAIVPNYLLGRVQAIAAVMSWSALPLGALLGGVISTATGNVMLVYVGMGMLMLLMITAFAAFSTLRHAEHYLPKEKQCEEEHSQLEARLA